ncbi:MAG: hypothetical protein ACJ8GN_29065 [Longimicrobiaceae bacterium]
MPTTVVHHEALFYVSRETGKRMELDLARAAREGRIVEVTASPEEIAGLRARFDASFRTRLDAGEAEALAYLTKQNDEDVRFVSSDASALEAVAMLGIAERAVCLSEALQLCGLSRSLPRQHGLDFFREHISVGLQRFVTGEGLSR